MLNICYFDFCNQSFYFLNVMKKIVSNKIYVLILVISLSQFLFLKIPNIVFAKSTISQNKILTLVNQERAKNGLNPLLVNVQLEIAANNKAQYLLDNDLFEHNTKNKMFREWIKETDYKYSIIGENLATNFYSEESIMDAWMNSNGHRDNILDNYTDTGIGIKEKNGKILVVQIFGRPDTNSIDIEKTIGNHISECLLIYLNNSSIKQNNINLV